MVQRSRGENIPLGRIRMLPQVNFDDGSGRALSELSDSLFRISQRVEDRLDDEAVAESTRQAIRDGGEKRLNKDLLFAPTIRGRAYTSTALKELSDNIELDTRSNLNRILQENPADGRAVRAKSEGYIQGQSENMPAEMRKAYLRRANLSINASVAKANAAALKVSRDRAEGALKKLDRLRREKVEELAGDVMSENEQLREHALNELQAMAADQDAVFSSDFVDSNGTPHPLFSEDERITAQEAFDTSVKKAVVRRWFSNRKNKQLAMMQFIKGDLVMPDPSGLFGKLGKSVRLNQSAMNQARLLNRDFVAAMDRKDREAQDRILREMVKFERDNGVNVQDALNPIPQVSVPVDKLFTIEEKDKIISQMNSEMRIENALVTQAENEAKERLQAERDKAEFVVWQEIRTEGRLTPFDINRMVQKNEIDPEEGVRMMAHITTEKAVKDDPETLRKINRALYHEKKDIAEMINANPGKLTPETERRLWQDNAALNKTLGDETISEFDRIRGAESRSLHEETEFSTDERTDPLAEQRQAEAMTEFRRRERAIREKFQKAGDVEGYETAVAKLRNEIADRATRATRLSTIRSQSRFAVASSGMLRPIGAVDVSDSDAASFGMIDIEKTMINLNTKLNNGEITKEEWSRQVNLTSEWSLAQQNFREARKRIEEENRKSK